MADIWQQFHSLPKAIRDGVATPSAIQAIDELEAQYPGVDLANIVMRTVVHEFPIADLPKIISSECNLDPQTGKRIADSLIAKIFVGDIAEYLGLAPAVPTPAPAPVAPAMPPTPVQVPLAPLPSVPTPVAMPVSRELPSSPVAPPKNLPIAPVSMSETPPMPKVPAPSIRSTAPQPMTTSDLDRTLPISKPTTSPMMAPATPIGPVSPTTQYSDEDAKEIESQVARLKQLSNINPNQDFDTIARRTLTEQNLAYSDELLDRRAVAIIKARLKGVRSTDETQEILTRDAKIGGLGLDLEIAKNVATAADKYAQELKAKGMVREPEAMPPPPPVPIPKISQERPEPKPLFRREGTTVSPVIPVGVTDAPRASRPIVRPVDIPAPAPAPTPVKTVPVMVTPKPSAIQAMSAPTMSSKQRGVDRPTTADVVRPMTRALGPAEEMRSMTLIEFRRLGQGAGESAQRLLDKFKHLQKESFAVWAEAVAGWRQSDVYQLYLQMGRDSMEKGIPMSQVIADRGRQGQPYLSEHEFTILADLNRHLLN
jgi:hypothetical protein